MKKAALFLAMILSPLGVYAQTGLPPFGSFSSSAFDAVNNQNLNVYFAIPLVSSAGRGMPLSLSLVNNSLLWQKVSNSWTPVVDSNGNPTWGWQRDFPSGGAVSFTTVTRQIKCFVLGYPEFSNATDYSEYVYTDAYGTGHGFPSVAFTVDDNCPTQNYGTTTGYSGDSTGYYVDATNAPLAWVVTHAGTIAVNGTGPAIDVNGNYVTKTVVSSTVTTWTDSVGNVALKITYTPNATSPTSITYQFLDGTGATNYQTITLTLTPTNIKTNFACSGVGEYTSTGTVNMPTELDIPTPGGSTLKYLFAYEPTPSHATYFTGRVKKVTLPTGGSYEYDYSGATDSVNCADGTTVNVNRVVSDGTTAATWSFTRDVANLKTTVTTPILPDTSSANDTVYAFNSFGQETSRKIYSNSPGTGTPLRTINSTWSGATPATQMTILEDGATQSETDTSFDSYGNLLSKTQYDWGTGTHGSSNPIRTTTYTYLATTNYTSRNILNRVTRKVVTDGGGTIQFRQDIGYDETTLGCPTGSTQHDEKDYPCAMIYRGNPTSIKTYKDPVTPATPVTRNVQYDWFGNAMQVSIDGNTQRTSTFSTATQFSQPDSTTSGSGPQITTSATYNIYTGQVATSSDANGQITHYAYDFLRRLTSAQRPDLTSISKSYSDTAFTITTITPIDGGKSVQQVTSLDSLGRPYLSETEDAGSTVYSIVTSSNDLVGRAYKTSNPYTGSPSYWTTTLFDAI